MELMIAVAVAGILLAVAVPSYQRYVQNSKRAVAGACLVEMSQFMERVYTASMAYNVNNGNPTVLPTSQCRQTLTDSYVFALNSDTQVFTISAQTTGAQSADTECGTLSINQAGVRSANGDSSLPKLKKCWG